MREIPLTQGLVAVIDDEDYDRVSRFKWCAEKQYNTFYAVRSIVKGKPHQYMHRLITEAPAGKSVDHRDGNGLNNRRGNLRVCTHMQNHFNRGPNKNNTSGYKGVGWDRTHRKWTATIAAEGKAYRIGYFNDPISAAQSYDRLARELHGEFAYQNFPLEKD